MIFLVSDSLQFYEYPRSHANAGTLNMVICKPIHLTLSYIKHCACSYMSGGIMLAHPRFLIPVAMW